MLMTLIPIEMYLTNKNTCMNNRHLIILLLCFLPFTSLIAQESYQREVIIKIDTTYEVNNMRYTSEIVETTAIKEGLRLYVLDSPYRVTLISQKKDGYNSGIFLSFYVRTNMPREKGIYRDGDKDGEWFYWNEQGALTMKKIWKKGKLLKTVKY